MSHALSRRALELLAAVEREAEERRRELAGEALHVDAALLGALELAVAGLTRDEVAERLRAEHGVRDADPLLDAVFAGYARLRREHAA